MSEFVPNIETLKVILEHLRQPRELDDHPWADGRLVQSLVDGSPGEKLARSIREIFRESLPSHPPRHGKRLDTRWGAYGLLAAQYFAPIDFNLPTPHSQREAWLSIDQVILLYVFGAQADFSQDQRDAYRLVGNETQVAPNSTLSGWKRKGLERLLEEIIQREQQLVSGPVFEAAALPAETSIENASSNITPKSLASGARASRSIWKWTAVLLGLLLLIFAAWAGWQADMLFRQLQVVRTDVDALKPYLGRMPQAGEISKVADRVKVLREDLGSLQTHAGSWLWLAPRLAWVPKYGGDLAQAGLLLDLAGSLVSAADEGLQAVLPAAGMFSNQDQPLDMLVLLDQLQKAQPRLLAAQLSLARAQETRAKIDPITLSPGTRAILEDQVDLLLQAVQGKFQMEDALALINAAPSLLGAGKAGPRTYLLLMQNEDEMRPTGGFITAAGSLVVKDGKLLSIKIENSSLVDDFSKPYPQAPWQLNKYMNLWFLIFRDANWFTNYPTTAEMAEYLYSYSRAYSVDGVIAIDQHVIVELLKILGPVRLVGVPQEITSKNVQEYMRSAKEHTPPGFVGIWDPKQFIGRLAQPLIENALAARGEKLGALAQTLIAMLDQRHILLQMDDPALTEFLSKRNWDGAVRAPANSDFLMAVDANVGYNKTHAVIETTLTYDLDLSEPNRPTARLAVIQSNHASGVGQCVLLPTRTAEEREYSINECYWSYLRVYSSQGTQLISSGPHGLPAEATMDGIPLSARTDVLGNEGIPGVDVFGSLVLIPRGKSISTTFTLALPEAVLHQDASGVWTYRLTVQKQAGTQSVPLALRVRLPVGAKFISGSPSLVPVDDVYVYNTDLLRDVIMEIRFANGE